MEDEIDFDDLLGEEKPCKCIKRPQIMLKTAEPAYRCTATCKSCFFALLA